MPRHIKGNQRVLDVMDGGEGEKKTEDTAVIHSCVPVSNGWMWCFPLLDIYK